ncbi:hypothetical protein K435DRAFT_858130 [Dendrothele bispora CBS 962.96]|uniref:Uncharacterized protein n=1 Tax=Dendrothele bispora (strain CBS 962.96) TaxID=1314807 RepID=A0A4S8M4D0_DENBC|nr:hypothetical protein K435DRAFT_858130 [Dendrothele bispora CBS 962.96]
MSEPIPDSTAVAEEALNIPSGTDPSLDKVVPGVAPGSKPGVVDTSALSAPTTDVLGAPGVPGGGVLEGEDEGEESDTYDDFEGEEQGGEEEGAAYEDDEEEEEEVEPNGQNKASLTALLLGNGTGGPTNGDGPYPVEELDQAGGEEEEDDEDDEEYVDRDGDGLDDPEFGAVPVPIPDPSSIFNGAASSKKRTFDEVHEDDGGVGAGEGEGEVETGEAVKKVKA